ncbi:hypothetical protein Ocin01_06416 [Orchesella cincta]|uniref:Poly(3-hydroxyalkanoate) depolymerase C n=1 Tax=Orchesella cincta TaxID=48709 RepID=A0A1D2N5A9_ORCCI|nr:hypothetical protein Ocin01_06416 [Orchesella cincta]
MANTKRQITFFSIRVTSSILLVVIGVQFHHASSATSAPSLYEIGPMNIFRDQITLSGFSAGASMAIQTHLSHSSLFSGLAVFSQVFYHCGHRSLIDFGIRCSKTGLGLFPYSVSNSISDAKEYDRKGLIDPLVNVAKQQIFIWTGDLDAYIPSDMAKKNVEFYKGVGVDPNNIRFTIFKNASHLIPTDDFGPACNEDAGDSLYLGNCNYPGVYHAFSYILKNNSLAQAVPHQAQLMMYNQSAFYPNGNIKDVAMGTAGFIYIPKQCETQQCRLHLNFHGCNEWPPHIAEQYILHSGFLPVAEANGIIVVFPLTTKVPKNMDGCWDFFSYTGSNFATKKGAQIQVIERMLNKILSG